LAEWDVLFCLFTKLLYFVIVLRMFDSYSIGDGGAESASTRLALGGIDEPVGPPRLQKTLSVQSASRRAKV
jgi:hypothetical protein